ncbi:MAG: UvrD-helicase domain-containing protein, partial [Treponema sp.]|nr:UvrD-helicase domain-containing protein [Treponema sp.]
MSQSAVEKWLLEGDGSENSRSLSDEQRNAVTFMGNTVTAAGAGSGKTFVLARRFAYLVCIKKYKVSQILTLTFTKKATTEMYS